MLVNLDLGELWYLLESCLRGSHLRAHTIERYVNEFYDKLEEYERMQLFEWAVRLAYAWDWRGDRCFNPSPECCGADIAFMKRYHPLNQYNVTMSDGSVVRAFKTDDRYFVGVNRFCDPDHITKVEHLDFPEWEEWKQNDIDYDTNIIC